MDEKIKLYLEWSNVTLNTKMLTIRKLIEKTKQLKIPLGSYEQYFVNVLINYRYKIILANYIKNNIAKKYFNYIPKTKDNYIGIEIECFAPLEKKEMINELCKSKLIHFVECVRDGSISPIEDHWGHELRILSKEQDLSENLKKIHKFLKKIKAKTNKSCGLHIHLDMRNKSKNQRIKCLKQLVYMQDLLFKLVNKNRSSNEYCRRTPKNYNYKTYSRYAVHLCKTGKETIEVRLHHGTTNMILVENWIKLLLAVINYKGKVVEIQNKTTLYNSKIKLPRGTRSYIERTYRRII